MSRGLKIGLIIGGVILAVLIVLPLAWGGFSGWRGGWSMMGPGMMGGFGWGWLPLLGIVFWGLVIWGIVAAVRSTRTHECGSTSTESALEVLKRRYALGEIKKKEYEEKKRDLS